MIRLCGNGGGGRLLTGAVLRVKVTSSGRVARMSIWDWFIEPLGDGKGGKTSIDSSKKEGMGTGGRVILDCRAHVIASVGVTVIGRTDISPGVPGSARWLAGGDSRGVS